MANRHRALNSRSLDTHRPEVGCHYSSPTLFADLLNEWRFLIAGLSIHAEAKVLRELLPEWSVKKVREGRQKNCQVPAKRGSGRRNCLQVQRMVWRKKL